MYNFFSKKNIKPAVLLVVIITVLFLPYFVFAQDIPSPIDRLDNIRPDTGYEDAGSDTLAEYVGSIVRAFLILLGVIFVILIIYGGYTWMTSAGNEEKLSKARKILWRAIIGLIVLLASYAIWFFAFTYLIE